MRIDKYLKVSRIIKRRTVAAAACDGGRVSINNKTVKPSAEVKVGDIIEIRFGEKTSSFEVLAVTETVRAADAANLYKVLN